MIYNDRMKAALFALIRAALPRVSYLGAYMARVVLVSKDGREVDIEPEDVRLPSMAGVPVRHGIPAFAFQMPSVTTGTTVLVSWADGDPSKPFAMIWGGGEQVSRMTLTPDQLFLGDKSISDGGSLVPVQNGALSGVDIDFATGAPQWTLGNGSSVVAVKK